MDTIRTQIATGIDFWRPLASASPWLLPSSLLPVAAGRPPGQAAPGRGRLVDYPRTCQHPGCGRPSQVRGWCLKHLGRGFQPLGLRVALLRAHPLPIVGQDPLPTLGAPGCSDLFAHRLCLRPADVGGQRPAHGMIGRGGHSALHETSSSSPGHAGWRSGSCLPAELGGNAEQFRIVELTGIGLPACSRPRSSCCPSSFAVSLMLEFLWRLAPSLESYPCPDDVACRFDQALFLSSTMYSKTWRRGGGGGPPVRRGEVVWAEQFARSPVVVLAGAFHPPGGGA